MSDLKEIGKSQAQAIIEMVAALECDYERLEELRGKQWVSDGSGRVEIQLRFEDAASCHHQGDCERDVRDYLGVDSDLFADVKIDDIRAMLREYGSWDETELADDDMCYVRALWLLAGDMIESEDYAEWKELIAAAGECTSREEAETRIQEDALSVQVRSIEWYSYGDHPPSPNEFEILLSTGGPATRIRGELSNGEPIRAWLDVQDWGTPWTQYDISQDTLLAYAHCFYFGES